MLVANEGKPVEGLAFRDGENNKWNATSLKGVIACYPFPFIATSYWRHCARIVETEPEPVLVPWTLGTVPKKRMLVQHKNINILWYPSAFDTNSVLLGEEMVRYDDLAIAYEHSLDDGVSWHPCGSVA